jgi:hypothetical protein
MNFFKWLVRKPTHKVNVPDIGWSAPCACPLGKTHHWNDLFPVVDGG